MDKILIFAVFCLERGADLHMAQLMPLPLTVSCSSKIQIGFTFMVPAHLGRPVQRAVKLVCVCVCAVFKTGGFYKKKNLEPVFLDNMIYALLQTNWCCMGAGKDLLSTDLQYVDCYILQAVHTLYDLYIETGR